MCLRKTLLKTIYISSTIYWSAISPFLTVTFLLLYRPTQVQQDLCKCVIPQKQCMYSDLVRDTCKRQSSKRNMQMCINTNRWSLYVNNSYLTAQTSKHKTKWILRFAVVEHKVHSFLTVKLNVSWKLTMGFGIYTHREARMPLLPSSTWRTTSCFKIQSLLHQPQTIYCQYYEINKRFHF